MADKKISDLTSTSSLAGSDMFLIETSGGNSRKATFSTVRLSLGCVGAMVKKAADETAANYSSNTTVAWDAEQYDDAGFHDNVTNNSRLTVPDLNATYGKRAKRVSVFATLSISSATAVDWISLRLIKNGSAAVGLPFLLHEGGSANTGMIISAHNIPVTGDGTDYFQVQMQVESDASITVNSNRSSFQIWVTDWQ